MFTHPGFDPVALRLGPIAIHWYGLMYLLTFIGVFFLGHWKIRRANRLSPAGDSAKNLGAGSPSALQVWKPTCLWEGSQFDDFLFWSMIAVVGGGRLGFVLMYQPSYYLEHPFEIIMLWHGGMSFHGGFLAVVLLMAIYAKKLKRSFLEIADFFAPLAPIGLAAGRLGNFINGELWGRPTSVPWGMIFPRVDHLARHPSQIYELLGEGLLLFGFLWWLSSKPRALGLVSGAFGIGYGLVRFCAEYFREPDSFIGALPLGLTMGQWLSVPLFIAGAIVTVIAARRPEHSLTAETVLTST